MNPVVDILSLDHEGHGVARLDGKVTFVDGALAGERAEIAIFRKHAKYNSANAVAILAPSAQRAEPRCRYFGRCGGCSMQHLEPSAQVAAKQRVLEENLARIGKVRPSVLLPALHGPSWGYRGRARLSVRRVEKKGGVLVGFHEKRSSFIADMASCEVLAPGVSALIQPLRELIGRLSNADRIPQIEVAAGEHVIVLVFRLLEPWNDDDAAHVRAFADAHHVQVWEQRKGPETARPFWPDIAPELSYGLPEFGLVMPFRPTEFTQVNSAINRALVSRALRLLDPRPGERIADLFCGLGNFTLPIAHRGADVLGIEGSTELVARARENALRNALPHARFEVDNLFEMTPEKFAALGPFDKLLIDPPRSGAIEVVKSLPEAGAPRRIVYVSCDPATLARDAEVLVHVKGYRLEAAGVANMFPHTAHVESIALFER
ncbi:23S rRNA methyltransferase/RumA [Thiobacillus denitrificans ATCC 25259]|uniref:23S rRNA (uracil(1939)-C(5))-methyltransferase RlmD n=1 Tax=Thiobacillus denitrificans (strain ATCC 25259 / T1) TaxID=292415 RepID=RLMD_THIDA|nr:23S rRNA (uracil(1939)-C(5))-methyltransferase RlmD [Thiobacillus denitrificans]Q3SK67.1 RecName: Full=23S rRNA (uracil(1939)-C(5))-methyltransferase RlmD; AltName: Full=23S rRNA(m5U1939)-methyltransferase [Thiobacillus denitrificans ATCC 25259]AAZ96923.1 23S rRNA methyltransferase/RumA [Thiobacillus denitrificans ATCC 25259]